MTDTEVKALIELAQRWRRTAFRSNETREVAALQGCATELELLVHKQIRDALEPEEVPLETR